MQWQPMLRCIRDHVRPQSKLLAEMARGHASGNTQYALCTVTWHRALNMGVCVTIALDKVGTSSLEI